MSGLARFVATGLYSGYLRPYPANWGSLVAVVLAYLTVGGGPGLWLVTGIVVVLSVWSAGQAESAFGHDHRRVVIDEFAGMLVTLLFVPHTPGAYVLALVAFRVFDTAKLPPVRQLERMPGGWGVTLDDVAAGVQAGLVCWWLT